jgi:hypothetical protein
MEPQISVMDLKNEKNLQIYVIVTDKREKTRKGHKISKCV